MHQVNFDMQKLNNSKDLINICSMRLLDNST